MHPVTRGIIEGARRFDAVDVFDATYRLGDLKSAVGPVLARFDMLAVPSIPTIYTVAEVLADPVRLNSNLGTYTNFVNLLDMAAFSVPVGRRADGLPSSLTLIAPAGRDALLAGAAHLLETGVRPGAVGAAGGRIEIAVVGAHLSGMALNHELTTRGGEFLREARTAPDYALYALTGTVPPKPGLIRVAQGRGAGIALEIWSLEAAAFGSFVAAIPSPLGIGTLRLEDGGSVKGFLVEAEALHGATDISGHGGWRAFLASRA
jgi:allophanate hydrolase